MDAATITQLAGVAIALFFVLLQVVSRRRRNAAGVKELAEAVEAKRHIPPSLHPVIDTDICIGSLSCLKACPEGDILGVIDNAARLVHADHCIGHGRCAAECPVGAIKLVFGTAERGLDLPDVDSFFESSRPGVHVVGELGGMGLIKNALRQGLQVSERLHEVLPAASGPGPLGGTGVVDAVIVGAGPAGLAAAAGLSKRGRTFRVLEQGSVGGTVAQYPRQKVVMTEVVELPFLGRVGKSLIPKEELLASFMRLIAKAKLQIEEGVKVTGLTGADGAFTVVTDKGPVLARKVVLACGRRGSPRKLGVLGEALSKVSYRLDDPEQYDGCDVLVVGGGDSALEAAIQLVEQSSARVSISYRGDAFAKCRERNRKQLEKLGADQKLRVLLGTTVKEITAEAVTIASADGRVVTGPNDFVIVQAGGELPADFLGKMGVTMRRYHGEERSGPKPKAEGDHAEQAKTRSRAGLAKEREETARAEREFLLYVGAGLILLAWLASVGWEYYLLSHGERQRSPLHASLRPAGPFGHGVGIVATAFMLSNFLYPVRKRTRAMTGMGTIKSWLNFHTFVGFMSPLVIAFHAAFQSNNLLATGTAAALLIVVSTGLVGRFIYGLVPTRRGQLLELSELRAHMARLDARVRPLLAEASDQDRLVALLTHAKTEEKVPSMLRLLLRLSRTPFSALALRLRLLRARSVFPDLLDYFDFRAGLLRLERIRLQIDFFGALKALLRTWRMFHASLAVFLVAVIAAHIGVSVYLGYVWLF